MAYKKLFDQDYSDSFILVKKKYGQEKRPVVRVNEETYRILAHWADMTGLSLATVTHQAVLYANSHVVIVEE